MKRYLNILNQNKNNKMGLKIKKEDANSNKPNLTYNSKNIFVRLHFNHLIKESINIIKISKNDKILDFGCGYGELGKRLLGFNIIGYDKRNELSMIKDYKTLKPDLIFCLAVFEYFDKKELINLIKNFKKMNDKLKLVVSMPKENLFSRLGNYLFGFRKVNTNTKCNHKDVKNILSLYMVLEKEKKIFPGTNEITLWKFKA